MSHVEDETERLVGGGSGTVAVSQSDTDKALRGSFIISIVLINLVNMIQWTSMV
jgi:hypothetical protein